MVQAVTCPPEILNRLTRRFEVTGVAHVALYDKLYSRLDVEGYRVLSRPDYRNLLRCSGYTPERYELVATSSGTYQ
jgi:hypothetical protein